jgi:hypothetical protein
MPSVEALRIGNIKVDEYPAISKHQVISALQRAPIYENISKRELYVQFKS